MSEEFSSWYGDVTRKCGSLAIDLGLSTLAFDQLVKLLEQEKHISTILLLVRLYLKNKEYYNVVTFLVNGRDNEILSDYRVWKAIALSYFKLNNVQDSLNAVDYALKLKSDDQDTLLLKARIMSFLDDSSLKTQYEALISSYSDKSSKEYYQILVCYMQYSRNIGDIPKCFEIFQAISQEFSRTQKKRSINFLQVFSYAYQLYASTIYLTEGNINEAGRKRKRGYNNDSPLEVINEFLSISERNYNSSLSIQPLKILQGQISFIESIDLRESINYLNLELQILNNHAATLSEEGVYHKSILNYMIARNMLKLNPHENAQVAYEYFQNSLSLTPNLPFIWISVASLYLTLGQLEDSLATYSQAISLAMSFENVLPPKELSYYKRFAAVAWHGISQVYTVTLQLTNAIEALDHAISIVYQEHDVTTEQELTSLRNEYVKLNSQSTPHPNIVYSLPEVSMKLLLEYETCRDSFLFQNIDDLEIIDKNNLNDGAIKNFAGQVTTLTTQPPTDQSTLRVLNTANGTNSIAYTQKPPGSEVYTRKQSVTGTPSSAHAQQYGRNPQLSSSMSQTLNAPIQDVRTIQQPNGQNIVVGNQILQQQQQQQYTTKQPFVVFNHATQKQELVTPQIVSTENGRYQPQHVSMIQGLPQPNPNAYYQVNDGNVVLKPIQSMNNNEFITKVL